MMLKCLPTIGFYVGKKLPKRFTNRCVRDLAWVIASPPLVSGEFKQTHWWNYQQCLTEFDDCLPTLLSLDKKPAPLLTHLESIKSRRLGLRFEAYISFWLSTVSPNYTLLAQNIQLHDFINNLKHTIGEIDFIIKENKTGKIIHLEVAVKFYLGTEPYSDPYRWFGTNLNDQLGKKLDHLKQHQTQLLINHPEKTNYSIDERHCIIKGRLFYPEEQEDAPDGITDNHLRGCYLFQNNNLAQSSLILLDKIEWLAEFSSEDIGKRKIQANFSVSEKSRCYAVIENNTETQRIFYLSPNFKFPPCSF